MQVYRHQGGSPTTRLTLRRAGNLSRGHQNTHKILKRKKRHIIETNVGGGLQLPSFPISALDYRKHKTVLC